MDSILVLALLESETRQATDSDPSNHGSGGFTNQVLLDKHICTSKINEFINHYWHLTFMLHDSIGAALLSYLFSSPVSLKNSN